MVDVKREDVEAVKLALKGIMRQNIPVKDTIAGSMNFLYECYQWSKDKRYLMSAFASLQAYMELGFSYEDYQEKFDWLMKELGTCRELQFTPQFYPAAVIPLSRNRIKSVIGPWSASKYHTMPISEVLDDMIGKVKEKKTGKYEYHSNLQEDGKKMDRVFELLIGNEASYLHDVQKDMYYLLVLPKGERQ